MTGMNEQALVERFGMRRMPVQLDEQADGEDVIVLAEAEVVEAFVNSRVPTGVDVLALDRVVGVGFDDKRHLN